jgi:hypothetical protein
MKEIDKMNFLQMQGKLVYIFTSSVGSKCCIHTDLPGHPNPEEVHDHSLLSVKPKSNQKK